MSRARLYILSLSAVLNASSERYFWRFNSFIHFSILYAEWHSLASLPEVCQSFKEVLSTLRSVGDAHWARAVASALGVCLAGIRPARKVRQGNRTLWVTTQRQTPQRLTLSVTRKHNIFCPEHGHWTDVAVTVTGKRNAIVKLHWILSAFSPAVFCSAVWTRLIFAKQTKTFNCGSVLL